MITRKKFILLDINTIQRYFEGEEKVTLCERMLGKIQQIFAWTHLKKIPVISIMPAATKERQCEKLSYSCNQDCQVLEARNTTDRPRPHNQLIFCNRYENPFDEPLIDRVLSEIKDYIVEGVFGYYQEIIVIGIGKELTKTVLELLHRGKRITVLRDLVRIPGLTTEQFEVELEKMHVKGAKMITLKKFENERSKSWQTKKSQTETIMYA